MLSCNKPNIIDLDLFRVERQLKTGNVGQGRIVEDLEIAFTTLCNKDSASAYSSATSAFEAILKYLDIKSGDEVILSPLTFKSIPYSVIRSGATPIFIDTTDSYLPDWSLIEDLITEKTKLIVTTSLYGLPDNKIDILSKLDKSNKFWIVEDNAQAIGSKYKNGKSVGSSENVDFSIFSFYATKNITGCEGGIVVHNEDTEFFDLYRNNGLAINYNNNICIGTNLRMTDINATLVLSQFDRLDHITKNRNNQARIYSNLLNIKNRQIDSIVENTIHCFHQYTVELPYDIDRDIFVEDMKSKGILLGVYYSYLTNYDHELMKLFPRQDTPNALEQSQKCVSLPVGSSMHHSDIQYIANTFNFFLGKYYE
jgi:dTDP-4-amino-4,6-dideoxygalactose transaminase